MKSREILVQELIMWMGKTWQPAEINCFTMDPFLEIFLLT